MVKLIVPRRTSKNISVEEYWAIRQQFKKKKQPQPHQAYQQQQIQNRHRFQKQSERLHLFNPLAYFLSSHNDLADTHKTHTHAYLQSINYRLPEQLIQVKSLMFGLASILQNIGKIYDMLWEHLECDDAWKLIQTVLKDTREESYQLWLQKGLQKLVKDIGHIFHQTKFTQIFNTLCILMEVCFPKIAENQFSTFQFVQKLTQFYFCHSNKYIRKFSILSCSYILNNLTEQIFYKLIALIINHQTANQQPYQFIGDILAQRLKYSDGCLTPNSLQQFSNIVTWLHSNKANSDVITGFVHRLLTNLSEKQQRDSETLFDLTYVVQAMIYLCREQKMESEYLFKAVFLYLNEKNKEKHSKKRRLTAETLKLISQHLWQSLPSLNHEQHIYYLLALSFSIPLNDVGNIKNFFLGSPNQQLVLYFLQLVGDGLSKDLSMLLIVSFSNCLQKFFFQFLQINQTTILLVYHLCLLAKANQIVLDLSKLLNKKVEFSLLVNHLIQSYSNPSSSKQLCYSHTLVLLRVLLITKIHDNLQLPLIQLFNITLKQYYQVVEQCFSRFDPQNTNIFSCSRHINQIFLYSHSVIPFVQQGFDILQSFMEIQKKLGITIIDRQSNNFQLWQKIAINRLSISSEIKQLIIMEQSNCLLTVQSRQRTIRLQTLNHLKEAQLFGSHEILLNKIIEIDSNDIDLNTERQAKRMFLDSLRYLQQFQLPQKLNNILLCWCIGFAFTGFKLIAQSFSNFLSTLMQHQQQITLTFIMNFLEYYTFKNSRLFNQEIQQFSKNLHTVANLTLSIPMVELINADFNHHQLQTIQFIGLDRVTQAISKSERIKSKLGERLLNLITQYFTKQFTRQKQTLLHISKTSPNKNSQISELLLPPKTTFLTQLLKILPKNYLPPIQCLHYTHNYLQLQSILQIKKQQWQLLWHKTTKINHHRIIFQNMSNQQIQLYIHFLWGELLHSDANRLRIIVQYIRDYMNNHIQYFMEIYFNEITLGVTDQEQLKRIVMLLDQRKLLTFIYILKAIIKILRNFVRKNFEKFVCIVMICIEVLLQSRQMDEQKEEIQSDQENPSQKSQQNHKNSDNKIYKNHRKQLYKILNSLVNLLANDLPNTTIDYILQVFEKQGKIATLGKISVNSTPGLLLLLKQIAKHRKFHNIFIKYHLLEQLSHVFQHCRTLTKNGPIHTCINIINNILSINTEQQTQISPQQIEQKINIPSDLIQLLLQSIHTFLNSCGKISNDIHNQLLQITRQLMSQTSSISTTWQHYLLTHLTKTINTKSMTPINKNKLTILIHISMEYTYKSQNNNFITSLMILIPQLKQIQHRQLITQLILRDISSGKQQSLSKKCAKIVQQLNSTIIGSLTQQLDYPIFFQGVHSFKQNLSSFTTHQLQFIIYNMLPYIASTELSVRKAVSSSISLFLSVMDVNNKQLVFLIYRILCEQLKKPYHAEQHLFWSILSCIGHFCRWIIRYNVQKSPMYESLAKYLSIQQKQQQDIFEQLCSIAQNKKLDGLKSIKAILQYQQLQQSSNIRSKCPNLLTSIFLPILQHFIIPSQNQNIKSEIITTNLASSLTHVSLQIYVLAMKRGGQSLQKKQCKRMISKLKFNEQHIKRNLIIIKILGQIIESIALPKATETIRQMIKDHGFQQFHQKLLNKSSKTTNLSHPNTSQQSDQQQLQRQHALTPHNNQIQDDQLLNMNYLLLDKKLLLSNEQQHKQENQDSFITFLKLHVLIPLKSMLGFKNKVGNNGKQDNDKSRILISVVLSKVLIRFPLNIFIAEFQKIITKLVKLLKKKQLQIRQNARKCLAQIAKLVGTDLLYLIFRQIKQNLKDNFQNHIINYTIYYILQKCGNIENGSIDHSLPFILPSIIDQIFGRTSLEKQMVNENTIPTLNMQAKKKKGNDLLTIICRCISIGQIQYLVKYFQKFLFEFMNSQNNISKYEQMLTYIVGGLNKNQHVCIVSNANYLIEILYKSISQLKGKIKIYQFGKEQIRHESTIKQEETQIKKIGKEALEIQEQAGRNGSIFKKQAKQIQQKRNQEILIGCFIQFYQTLLTLLIKKKIVNEETTDQKFAAIISFVVQCTNHRDNRLVYKSLKIIHSIIHWKKMKNIQQIRKKISKRIFQLIEKLTAADENLLKECFTILNDLFQEVTINTEVLHILTTIIKLHITTVERMVEEEPYKLFKTVLIKISQSSKLLLDCEVYELYELVRGTLLTTTFDHIRSVCKDICCFYIKHAHFHEEHHKKQKHRSKASYNCSQQVSFYLNNLDCKYSQTQLAVIEVIKAYVQCHSKDEVEETGEAIVMGLGAAYSNDQDNHQKLGQTIKMVILKIDNSKSIGLIQKCLVWASLDDKQPISICGFFILSHILESKQNLLNNTNKLTIINLCQKILSKQYDDLLIYQIDIKQKNYRIQTIKSNPQWQNIIDDQDPCLKIEKNYQIVVQILDIILVKYKSIENNLIDFLWKLVAAPSSLLHCKSGELLMKVNSITSAVGEKLLSLDKDQDDSLRNKIVKFVRNVNEQYGCKLSKKILQQIKNSQVINNIVESVVFALLNRISKSILNLKKNEGSMKLALEMLQIIITVSEEVEDALLKNEKIMGEIFWNIAKVSRNQLIDISIKQKSEEFGQIIKARIGQAEFYRRLASTEVSRKQKKAEGKAQLLKLAITDQQAYAHAKAKKRFKKG